MKSSYNKKQETNIITVVVKKKLLNIILKTGKLKKNANKYKSLSEEEKEAQREYQRNRCKNMKEKTS